VAAVLEPAEEQAPLLDQPVGELGS
jgi:hypothetical protein